ncbi:MAG: rRNA pseudouridine synthase [Bauldia sp.]|nr:rRNA pseudouridine synthase [Bauldia sp.]
MPDTTPSVKPASMRIAKLLARAGLCSRRDAERWIAEGRVSVNGRVLLSPALDVSDADRILVDGKPLPERERTRLWLYHKPKGLVTTARDPEGRPTVFAALPPELPRVVAVGRLDINTEGLLLLTNDGGLARVLELPATGWLRRYRVRVHGTVTPADLAKLGEGTTVDGVHYGPVEAALERVQGTNAWLVLGLREGKNREVKEVLGGLGLSVNRLIRISFGPFQLGDLAPGAVREIPRRILRDQIGAKLAAEAGLDFEAPLRNPAAAPPEGRSSKRPHARPPRSVGRSAAEHAGDGRPHRHGASGKPARAARPDRADAPRPSRRGPTRGPDSRR